MHEYYLRGLYGQQSIDTINVDNLDIMTTISCTENVKIHEKCYV